MNESNVSGKLDQIVGKVKQGVGEAFGNQSLANEGAADQVKGNVKESWGDVKDAASDVHDHARAEAHSEARHDEAVAADRTHDTRNSITDAAERAKESIQTKLNDFKREHNS